jgi:15-cis-phytoene synthase
MAAAQPHRTGDAFDAVRLAARNYAFDDYLVALLSPRAQRADLITLAAYFGDVARIPLVVTDPNLGEIRLQWWRDAIERGSGGGHPVADALVDAATRIGWPVATLLKPLDAHAIELYSEPVPSEAAFDAYLSGIGAAQLTLQAQCMGVPDTEASRAIVHNAGQTLALVRLLCRLPQLMTNGRLPLPAPRFPESWLEELGDEDRNRVVKTVINSVGDDAERRIAETSLQLNRAPAALRQSALSVALARPYLRARRRPGYDPLRQIADISPITRVWTLWLARMRGRI